ncbi:RtcB family protein [Candidatus Dependentiae bacterium]|nr:RtcB family protein [Candidatus Dependentiae bacterium]
MEDRVLTREKLIKIDDNLFEIPQDYRSDMRVPARVYTSEDMLEDIVQDMSLWQLVNVATLPGIQKAAYAMPDIHQGYGFPIGGVAATAIDQGGVISPGGIGYDINCGVRLLVANVSDEEVKPYLASLADALFVAVPSGVGRGGKLKLSVPELDRVLRFGAKQMVKLGFGTQEDLAMCEEQGCMEIADPEAITPEAKKRGDDQLGTLGSGNHFLEVQAVDEIYDEQAAAVLGLSRGQVTVMIHCGSRGLGHQTCTDYVRTMMQKVSEWGYQLPDRELVCAPFLSTEGQAYFTAMAAAANFAWANRHVIGHWVRQAWQSVMGNEVWLRTLYDVSHNIGKRERRRVHDHELEVVMHRKGATRAFGPGHPEVPSAYRTVGQPVLIPGTMGTASYILVGTQESMDLAFGSSCHGAGRKLSRHKAKKMVRGSTLRRELEAHGIMIRCDSDAGLAEEAPLAYKDVDSVVNVVHNAGLARKVARVKPLAVIKGG